MSSTIDTNVKRQTNEIASAGLVSILCNVSGYGTTFYQDCVKVGVQEGFCVNHPEGKPLSSGESGN